EPGGAGYVELGHQVLDVHLPGALGGGVHAPGARRVELGVWRAFGAVEDHVGADVNQGDARLYAGEGHVAGAQAVHGEGGVRVALRAVHVCVGGGVYYQVEVGGGDRLGYGLVVGQVVLGAVQADQFVPDGL